MGMHPDYSDWALAKPESGADIGESSETCFVIRVDEGVWLGAHLAISLSSRMQWTVAVQHSSKTL